MRNNNAAALYDTMDDFNWIISDDNNLSFFPAFLFIPKELLVLGGKNLWETPRSLNELLKKENGLAPLQTDYFFALLVSSYSFMVWQVIRKEYHLHPVRQVYSLDNPIVLISGLFGFWIYELEEAHILPTGEKFLSDPFYRFHTFGLQTLDSAISCLTVYTDEPLK